MPTNIFFLFVVVFYFMGLLIMIPLWSGRIIDLCSQGVTRIPCNDTGELAPTFLGLQPLFSFGVDSM